jgi:hypothetical protein
MSMTAIFSAAKKAAPLVGLLASLTAFVAYSNWLIGFGESRAIMQMQGAQVELANAQRKELEQKMAEALDIQAQDHADAIDRLRNEREVVIVTKEVIEYVDKIIIDDSCHKLAIDFIGMRQQATSAIRGAGAGASAED